VIKLLAKIPRKILLPISIIFAVSVLIVLAVEIINLNKNQAIASDDLPSVSLLRLDGDVVTVEATAKDLEDTNALVYCLKTENSYNNCRWQAENEFTLTEERVYYIFVKDLRNSAVSPASLIDYKFIDYSQMRM